MRNNLIILSFLALAAVSCKPGEQTGRTTVPLVRTILSDKSSGDYVLLHDRAANPSDDVCIIGSESVCNAITEKLLTVDQRDNVNGGLGADDLLDFSGETFCNLLDTESRNYSQMLARHEDIALRERAVKLALAALDTTFHLSPYDIDGNGGKTRAKLLVLTDSRLAQHSHFDIDTLFRSASCSVPVISPLAVMFEEVFKDAGTRPVNVGIICDSVMYDSVSYKAMFNALMRRNGANATCTIIPRRKEEKGLVMDFLDDYIATGNQNPINVIILDTYSADIPRMKYDLARCISVMNEESMTYGKYIATGISIVDPASAVCRKCYEILRAENLFSHNISKPQAITYYSAAKPDAEDNSIILISGNYVQN